MPSFPVIKTLIREITTSERSPRVPEPDLVMDDPQKVAAYTRAGREDGVMAPVYLYHCAQICDVIRPGDTVVDLACGPATQLAMVARLNPQCTFTGVDLSEEMLERARTHIADSGLTNVTVRQGDIATLDMFDDDSIDTVFSTMALHHLPDGATLERVFQEITRILKPDGGIYLVDFGHLKSEKSIDYFTHQYADRQPDLFTLDYLYSLRAAFSLADFRRAGAALSDHARMYATFLMPFMVAFKSPSRRTGDTVIHAAIDRLRQDLPAHHQVDLKDLVTFFRLGGLVNPLLRRTQAAAGDLPERHPTLKTGSG